MKIYVKNVKIREDRWVRDISNTDGLKESMGGVGLIEPIVLDEEMFLLAGLRRLTFAKELGWKEIEAVFLNDLTEVQKKTIELEENIRRKMLSWDERSDQIAELHRLNQGEHGIKGKEGPRADTKEGWGMKDTAGLTGIGEADVSYSVKLSDAMKIDPEIRKATSRNAALMKIKRKEMQEIRRILADRAMEETKDMFVLGDCTTHLKDGVRGIADESVGMVLTDIPYGIEVENIYDEKSERMDYDTKFDDSPEKGLGDFCSIRDELYRAMGAGSHLWVFCGFDQVIPIREHYGKKFRVRHMPLIWNKMVRGYAPTPDFMIPRNWECLMFMSKGTRAFNLDTPIGKKWGDVLEYKKVPSLQKEAINEKPIQLLRDLILLSSDEGELVLDPFCGSGTTVCAALLEDRRGLGIDISEESLVIARAKVEMILDERDLVEEDNNDTT